MAQEVGLCAVNTDSTGFLQSPNVLTPPFSFLCPPFSRGFMVRAPQPVLGYSKGSQQARTEVLKALAFPLLSLSRPG